MSKCTFSANYKYFEEDSWWKGEDRSELVACLADCVFTPEQKVSQYMILCENVKEGSYMVEACEMVFRVKVDQLQDSNSSSIREEGFLACLEAECSTAAQKPLKPAVLQQ